MNRSYDVSLLQQAYESNPVPEEPLDYQSWLNNPKHIMLVEGDDVGLLSWEYDGLYSGHWFFVSRGKKARDVARRMLKTVFEDYGARAVRGITPTQNRAACMMARLVGFKSYGVDVYPSGKECELFIMTKKEL